MRLGSRAKLTIGVGLISSIGFAILGFREIVEPAGLVANATEERPAARQTTAILLAMATRPIHPGETITADMIKGAAADPAHHPMASVPEEVIGKVATREIPANTLIQRIALGREAKLAIRVPLGMRAISIDTTAEIAVAGLLRPGDRVDVQVVYPGADAISGARGAGRSQAQTLLQMVQVLAVGDAVVGTHGAETADAPAQSSAPAPAVARTVTLALFPEQVSALTLAMSTGMLHLSLRNPNDVAQPHVVRVTSSGPLPVQAAAVAVAPPRRVARPATPSPQRQPHAIDLVIGGRHKVIYSENKAP